MVDKLGEKSEFSEVDIDNVKSLESALAGAYILLISYLNILSLTWCP